MAWTVNLKHVKDAVQVSTGWSQADSQIQSTLSLPPSPHAQHPTAGTHAGGVDGAASNKKAL